MSISTEPDGRALSRALGLPMTSRFRDRQMRNMNGLLIDLDGVLYEGDRPIPGAADVLAWLDGDNIPHLFLTNTTSRPRAAIVERLAAMDIAVTEDQILTPPVAASAWLRDHAAGPAALFVPAATTGEFASIEIAVPDAPGPVGAVVVGDYGEQWDFAELNRAFRLLMTEPRPALIALGMTRYWRAPDGLRLDTAPFVKALEHATGVEAVVLGKPAREFFAAALVRLDVAVGDALMIGDDVRTDVGAAQENGIRGILVKTGKFCDNDLGLGIAPHATLDSIAALPDWWRRQYG
jgi:HAD superfamily hydrolase (TIGR01458 family)